MIYKKQIICKNEEETKNLAEKFASIAKRGDVFALYGSLGVGKSTFSRYFIKKLSDTEDVPSPTFTLIQTYDTENFEIHHYDMYRLKSPEEAYELNIEENFYTGVNLIEWPEKIGYLLPRDCWKIIIESIGSNRTFTIEANTEDKNNRLRELFID